MTTFVRSNIRRPRAGVDRAFTPVEVARAYNYPTSEYSGKGFTCGLIELGGGFSAADLDAYFAALGEPTPHVMSVPVAGGQNSSDGPNGADGEVLLDIEVAASVAPGASFRVYFAPNTDQGFLDAIKQACAECDVVSISWGGPESSWDPAVMDQFDAVFADARKSGVTVFAAAGDSGADDGTSRATVDFPASSPNVVGCGGTKLDVDASGGRSSEVTWDENARTSATGGGVSRHFPGRQVPDVAGNADPATGYKIRVDGEDLVVGGTSAVAPLYAGLVLLLCEATGGRLKAGFLSTILANPQVCYDVTVGNNGAFKAGPGRDETTGFGVVDGTRLLSVLTSGSAPIPSPTPQPPAPSDADAAFAAVLEPWVAERHVGENHRVQQAAKTWLASLESRGLA